MSGTLVNCPLWSDCQCLHAHYNRLNQTIWVDDCPRAGGGYTIPEPLVNSEITNMPDTQKARLTTWLIDRRLLGDLQPTITSQVIETTKGRADLPVDDRADRLLRFIARQSETVARRVAVSEETLGAYAWTESIKWQEVDYFLDYLSEGGLDTRGEIRAWILPWISYCKRIQSNCRSKDES